MSDTQYFVGQLHKTIPRYQNKLISSTFTDDYSLFNMANLQMKAASSPITLARFLSALAHFRLYFALPLFTFAKYLVTLALHTIYVAKYRVIVVTFRDKGVSYQ